MVSFVRCAAGWWWMPPGPIKPSRMSVIESSLRRGHRVFSLSLTPRRGRLLKLSVPASPEILQRACPWPDRPQPCSSALLGGFANFQIASTGKHQPRSKRIFQVTATVPFSITRRHCLVRVECPRHRRDWIGRKTAGGSVVPLPSIEIPKRIPTDCSACALRGRDNDSPSRVTPILRKERASLRAAATGDFQCAPVPVVMNWSWHRIGHVAGHIPSPRLYPVG